MVCKKCLESCDRFLPHILPEDKMVIGEDEINYYFFILEKLEKIHTLESFFLLPRVKKHFNFVEFPKIHNYLCRVCRKRFHKVIFKYLKSQMYESIFNIFSRSPNILCSYRKEKLKSHLERISKFVKCKDWRGIMYYWYSLYRVPYPLRNIVSKEEYSRKKILDLGGKIFNHALAYENHNYECLEYILEFYS